VALAYDPGATRSRFPGFGKSPFFTYASNGASEGTGRAWSSRPLRIWFPLRNAPSKRAYLGDPEIWPLADQGQDAGLTRHAVACAGQQPWRVVEPASATLGRSGIRWPNAEAFSSRAQAVTGEVAELPIFSLCSNQLQEGGPEECALADAW